MFGRSKPLLFNGLDSLKQFPAFLKPRQRVGDALEVTDDTGFIHDDGGGTLDANEVFREFEAMIYGTFRVGKYREWRTEGFGIFAGAIQGIAKNDQDLRPGFDKLLIHAPQLGDVRAALHSVMLAHEEKDNQ